MIKQVCSFNKIPSEIIFRHIIPNLNIRGTLLFAQTSMEYYGNLIDKYKDLWSRSISEAEIKSNPSLPLFKLIDGCRSLFCRLYLFRTDIQYRWTEAFVRWANDNDMSQDSITRMTQMVQNGLRDAEKLEYHRFPRKTAMIVLYFFTGFLDMGIILSFTFFLFLISFYHKISLELSLILFGLFVYCVSESNGAIVGTTLSEFIDTGITDREFLKACTTYGAGTSLSIAGILFLIRLPIIFFSLIPILVFRGFIKSNIDFICASKN